MLYFGHQFCAGQAKCGSDLTEADFFCCSIWFVILSQIFCNCRPETTFSFGGDDVVGRNCRQCFCSRLDGSDGVCVADGLMSAVNVVADRMSSVIAL